MTTSLLMASLAALSLQAASGGPSEPVSITTTVVTHHVHVEQRMEQRRTQVRWQTQPQAPAAVVRDPWVAQRRDGGRRGPKRGKKRGPGHHHRAGPACENLQTMAVMAVGFPEERAAVDELAQLVCGQGFAIPRQWPNGRMGRMSDTTWYWPNGRLARNGQNTFYWPNGRLAQNGKTTFYWPNGRLARNGSNTRYWPNGRLAQNGQNTWYWPSGRLAKNGTHTYYTVDGRMLSDRGSFVYAVCLGQERACRRRGPRDLSMPELLGLGWR